MTRFARALPFAAAMLCPAGAAPARASCAQNVLPVFQCGFAGWFQPPPPGAGAVDAVWWQLGYGNGNVSQGSPALPDEEGTGMAPAGTFSGNDSGLSTPLLSLADDQLPHYAPIIPDGSLCFAYTTWADSGVDGCADNPRTASPFDNDNLLNPYWGIPYGPCPSPELCAPPYYTTAYQIDYPLGVLLREAGRRWFALAFVASRSRAHDGTDVSEGLFDLAEVVNGAPNPVFPGRSNVIPWQPVPVPVVTALTGDPGPPWTVSLSWPNVQVIHDASTRPSSRLAGPGLAGGVGVLEQGPLVRYRIETAPLSPGDPNTQPLTWTEAATLAAPPGGTVTAGIQIASRAAVRVRTLLGKPPRTSSTSLASCRTGACGDLGFEASQGSPPFTVVEAGCADASGSDRDGDGTGDDCDLDDGLILIDLSAGAEVRYQLESGFVSFHVYRGDMEALRQEGLYTQDPSQVALAARFCGLTGGLLYDPPIPPAGVAVFYLATGVTGAGAESGLGTSSSGAARPNAWPCP